MDKYESYIKVLLIKYQKIYYVYTNLLSLFVLNYISKIIFISNMLFQLNFVSTSLLYYYLCLAVFEFISILHIQI